MFCVECGKEGPIYKDGVCIDCYIKSNSFSKGPLIIDIVVCPHCGSYKFKSTWTSDLFGELLRRVIKDNFHISRELTKIDINPICKESKDGADCKVYISGYIKKNEIVEKHNLHVRFKKTSCDVCSRRFGGYHEAIIQVRADGRKLTHNEKNNIVLLVENQVEHLQSKGNRGLFITDVGIEHGGLDFFISDKGAAFIITKKIQEDFGGEIKQSSKNIGMKDSRQTHRMTYLVRIPPFEKEDFIEYENNIYQILKLKANKIKMINLKNWEETIFDIKKLQKAKILGGKELVKDFILVSQNDEEVQIMNPETYEINIIKKPKKQRFILKNIGVIKYENLLFIEYKK